MASTPAVAVIDIGKSNCKLALFDLDRRAVVDVRTAANRTVTDGPYPHYDVDTIWEWLLDGLTELGRTAGIGAISVTTHGACFVLMTGDRLALPILDYEHDGPEETRAEYRGARGPYSENLSPELPNGLNAGCQLFWQSRRFPEAFAAADTLLPYPQYWVWRLTGERTSEATSLGCHTDLWAPRQGTWSRLAVAEGWDRLFPRMVRPWETVGEIAPAVARRTGLPASCRVVAGIHDSNASLLPHILSRQPPFAVLSTGTWTVVFAPGGDLDTLDAGRDCLANVDAFGHPVPSSRFMAGREYEIIAGPDGAEATDRDTANVIATGIMALPTFAAGTGPFGSSEGRWTVDPAGLTPGERAAAASLYAALVTDTCLSLCGAAGDIVVEGPFARNRSFLAALASLAQRPVLARPDATGTTEGAALLALRPEADVPAREETPSEPLSVPLDAYRAEWHRLARPSR